MLSNSPYGGSRKVTGEILENLPALIDVSPSLFAYSLVPSFFFFSPLCFLRSIAVQKHENNPL